MAKGGNWELKKQVAGETTRLSTANKQAEQECNVKTMVPFLQLRARAPALEGSRRRV